MMKKRLLSFVLCLLFVFSCIGVQAFAAAETGYDEMITEIIDRCTAADNASENAQQQQANGAYALAQLFAVIAAEKAEVQEVLDTVTKIMDDMSKSDNTCRDAKDQLVNGVYSCVELLSVIAQEFDTDGSNRWWFR